MQRFCASGLLLALGSAAADPQGYAVPQYDLMDMMVRDVPYEEVGEEPRRDEVRQRSVTRPPPCLVA